MLRIAWVAAIALFILGTVNPSFASEGSPDDITSSTAPVATDTDEDVTTVVTEADEDVTNDGVTDANEDEDAPPAKPENPCPNGADGTVDPGCANDVSQDRVILDQDGRITTNSEGIDGLGTKVDDQGQRLSTLETTTATNSNWQGWHFGAMFTASGAVLTGSDEGFVPLRIDGLVRYLAPSHVGFELTAGLGGWKTEDVFPFMFVVSPAFVTGGSHWSASVGPEYSVLQHPLIAMDAAHLVNLKFSGEYRPDKKENLMIRVFISPNLYNEGDRSGGLHLGASVGYHF